MIRSVSEIGDMVDFLKANPFVSMEDYKWKLNYPMIRLMTLDNTHINYLSEIEVENKKAKIIDGNTSLNDLGIPIFG